MYVLAGELAARGTVICATTTRIRPPEHLPVLTGAGPAEISAALAERGCVCAGEPAEHGKLAAPALPVAQLAQLADYVLIEADGSKGLPVKAHLPHEPVIPPEARRTILLAGASAFFRPAGEGGGAAGGRGGRPRPPPPAPPPRGGGRRRLTNYHMLEKFSPIGYIFRRNGIIK